MESVIVQRTEEQLHQLAIAQDLVALGEIHQRWGAALFGSAVRFTGATETAETLLADTLCRFWKDAPRYDRSKGRLFTYIMSIMKELAVSEGFVKQASVKGFGLHERAAELPADLRQVYELRCEQGLSDAEAARSLGIPVEEVVRRMRAAMKQLVNFVRQ